MLNFKEDNLILENTGYKEPKRVKFGKKKDYLMGDGKFGGEPIRPNGQWADDISNLQLEVQNKYCETFHCWIWNTIKAVCLLAWVNFGEKWDKSERFSGVMGGATPDGGSPHNGCETVRKDGLIPQEELPWTSDLDTFWKFSSPRPMPQKYKDIGQRWLRSFVFWHDWVVWPTFIGNLRYKLGFNIDQIIDENIANMVEALKFSPLGAGVLAWQTRNGMAYKNWSQGDNHWTLIVGYVYGSYWLVYDSYLDCWRRLEWRYPFKWVKRYSLTRNDKAQVDAEHIINTMDKMNVKGDKSPGVYWIYDGEKRPYRNIDEYNKICDRWYENRQFKIVANDALDLIPTGEVMDYDTIDKIVPFISIESEITKNI